ncbi:MAPEG family protein [Phenylobacterium sp. J367]|uniref:MAPEG family protein n=1 Tax=Phenylobacterium sp. J367 TaxID=2898435 RepID=UPI002151E99A|nr:MAPEG family protein [Phenylobacterium sp. J367]MCR5878744.1 MAPEG family protein [Phenylobacterium sp. J367]
MDRAQRNFLETFPIFAAAVLLLEVLDRTGSALGVWGAGLYLAGRVLFLPLYAAGLPWIRTFSWNAATLGLALVLAAVVAG